MSTKADNLEALRESTPIVMEYVKTHTKLSWNQLAARLGMRPQHMFEVRKGTRYIPSSRTWMLVKLLVDYGITEAVIQYIEGNPKIDLDVAKARRTQRESALAKLKAQGRRAGIF